MQIRKEQFDSTKHDEFKALSVHQPYANHIADGKKTIEVRTRHTNYRGSVLICSTANPIIEGYKNSVSMCITDIYDSVPFNSLTREQKLKTMIPENKWSIYENHAAWLLRDTEKINYVKVIGNQGLFNFYCTKGYIARIKGDLYNERDAEITRVKGVSMISFLLFILLFLVMIFIIIIKLIF